MIALPLACCACSVVPMQPDSGRFVQRDLVMAGTTCRYQVFVPLEDDRRTAAARKAVGNDVRYSELPDANQNAWDPAYASPDLWTWLFAQHR